MASALDSNNDEMKDSPRGPPRWTFAVLVVIALVLVSVAVTSRSADRDAEHDREHDPLELADNTELRAVVVAVSEVIRAPGGSPEEGRAIAALEAIRPRSPGAADLRDSCISTYRSPREAERLLREAYVRTDGATPIEGATVRTEEIHRLIREAQDSLGHCMALYESGAARLHLEPAHRPR